MSSHDSREAAKAEIAEEHRSGHDRRREPTRRDIDKRLLRVLIALAFVFLIVASVASIAAFVNAHDVGVNSKLIESGRIQGDYERDIAKWHFDVDGCKQGTRIFRALIARQRADAQMLARSLPTPEARNFFAKQIPAFNSQLELYQLELCDARFPKPRTPHGIEELD